MELNIRNFWPKNKMNKDEMMRNKGGENFADV